MNANELADMLEVDSWYKLVTREEIATMLRQQQAEIETLKQIIDANNLSQNIGQFVKPTNEPVAWRCKKFYETQEGWFYNENEIGEPLYTHPVKELTDEEISEFTHRMVLCCGVHPNSADINVLGLKFIVEEILRKAQE